MSPSVVTSALASAFGARPPALRTAHLALASALALACGGGAPSTGPQGGSSPGSGGRGTGASPASGGTPGSGGSASGGRTGDGGASTGGPGGSAATGGATGGRAGQAGQGAQAGKAGTGGMTGTGGAGGAGGQGQPGFTMVVTPTPVGGATKVTDTGAAGGSSIGLGATGQGAEAGGLPAASRLAIHYASVSVGTISVSVDGGAARRVNVHSSGAVTGSFLYAIIDIAIPSGSKVTVTRASGDVAVNIDKLLVGAGDLGLPPDIWNLSTFQPAAGPYKADWKALGLAYTAPQWWRDAKLGAWAHWDPQSMPEQGDWYALRMYQQNSADYNYHVAHFGDPSTYGYKDICKNWVVDQWDPKALMDLYAQMGAKYFMAMGSHHDNFDNFDSAYQPWNTVKVGVKKDMVGTWAPLAREKGLRFGIGFHNTPARTWGQWMPVRYTSGAKGPFDALQTVLDGKGKWWEGFDPVDLYGYKHTTDCNNQQCNNSPYGTQLLYRVDDAIQKYHPDLIYFDDHAGDSQVDLGVHMGLGAIAPVLLANFYNRAVSSGASNQGHADVVMNMKGVGGQYDSFQSSATLLPYVQRALVRSTEASTEPQISAYPFQTELDIQNGNWHYMTGAGYTSASSLVTTLMQNVSRNGSLLLNLTQHGRGNLDPQCTQIAKDIGAWLAINGEAVYASRPFDTWGDSSVLYTRHDGKIYATLLGWNGGAVTLAALKSGGASVGTVSKVELLGSTTALTFSQTAQGLTVTPSGSVAAQTGISDSQLASKTRVLRITHDKGRFNDDDPGATFPGWLRKTALGTGDFNNDLTTSSTVGDVWSAPFSGTGVDVYAPKETGAGKIEVQIDGQMVTMADLAASGARQAQQLVATVEGLTAGKHVISIINRGPGSVAVDALVVH